MRTARWRRSAEVALVGSGGHVGAAFRQKVRQLGHLQQAIQRIAMPWGPIWGLEQAT